MLVFGKIIGVLGKICLVLAFFVISASLIMIFLISLHPQDRFLLILFLENNILPKEGFGEIQRILGPFNISNFIVTALTLLPGMGLLNWSKKIKEKYKTRTNGT